MLLSGSTSTGSETWHRRWIAIRYPVLWSAVGVAPVRQHCCPAGSTPHLTSGLGAPVEDPPTGSSPGFLQALAFVAQGIEHRSPKAGVAGSNPAGGTARQGPVQRVAPREPALSAVGPALDGWQRVLTRLPRRRVRRLAGRRGHPAGRQSLGGPSRAAPPARYAHPVAPGVGAGAGAGPYAAQPHPAPHVVAHGRRPQGLQRLRRAGFAVHEWTICGRPAARRPPYFTQTSSFLGSLPVARYRLTLVSTHAFPYSPYTAWRLAFLRVRSLELGSWSWRATLPR